MNGYLTVVIARFGSFFSLNQAARILVNSILFSSQSVSNLPVLTRVNWPTFVGMVDPPGTMKVRNHEKSIMSTGGRRILPINSKIS